MQLYRIELAVQNAFPNPQASRFSFYLKCRRPGRTVSTFIAISDRFAPLLFMLGDECVVWVLLLSLLSLLLGGVEKVLSRGLFAFWPVQWWRCTTEMPVPEPESAAGFNLS
jgi:hypothetical protein